MGTVQIDGSTPKLTIGNATAEDATILFDGNAQDFYIALDDSADDLIIGLGSTVGTTPIISIDENKLSTFSGAITVGVDDTGHDVKFFGATASSYMLWDESANSLLLNASTIDLNGTADGLILDADADTTISSPTDDQIDIEIAGADDFKFTANTFTAISGSDIVHADTGSVRNRPNANPYIINGNFDVWQRGTSFTTSVYTADRWLQDLSGASSTLTRVTHTVGQTDVPNNPTYYLKQNVTTGNDNCGMLYRIEDVDTLTGAFTLSFYAKGVNPNSGNLDIIIQQNFGSGGSTTVSLTEQDLTLTSSWQKFVFTGTLASISGKTIGTSSYIQIIIKQPSDDSNTAAWNLQISQVQLESGTYTSATIPPFQHESYGDNLARCQRYFQELMSGESYNPLCHFMSYSSGVLRGHFTFPTQMRANPTQTNGAALDDFLIHGEDTNFAPTALGSEAITKKTFAVTASSSSSEQGSSYFCRGDAEATYTLDSEL